MLYIFGLIPIFLLGIAALILSLMSWRIRTKALFWWGTGLSILLWVYSLYNFEFTWFFITNRDMLLFSIPIVCVHILPLFFLFSSRLSKSGTGDESDVTDSFLDEIINGPDSEV